MPYKTENQLNSIRSVDGFQCLLSALHKCWHPVGLLRLRMNATVSCRKRDLCDGSLAARSWSCLEEWLAVRLRKTRELFLSKNPAMKMHSLLGSVLDDLGFKNDGEGSKSLTGLCLSVKLPRQSWKKAACQVLCPLVSKQKQMEWVITHRD